MTAIVFVSCNVSYTIELPQAIVQYRSVEVVSLRLGYQKAVRRKHKLLADRQYFRSLQFMS